MIGSKVMFTYRDKLRVVIVDVVNDDYIEGRVELEDNYVYANVKDQPYKRFLRDRIQQTAGFPGDRPSIKILTRG